MEKKLIIISVDTRPIIGVVQGRLEINAFAARKRI